MITILVFLAAAFVAILPSVGIASVYLKRRDIAPEGSTVGTFMKVAPAPLKAALITLNFVMFGVLCGGSWYLLQLLDG